MHGRNTQRDHGNVKLVVVALLVAVSIGANFAWNLYESGARDPSYIIFMALAAVIALALAAPRMFSGRNDEEWGADDEWRRPKRETPMPADSIPSNEPGKDSANGH